MGNHQRKIELYQFINLHDVCRGGKLLAEVAGEKQLSIYENDYY